jgi:DNA-binding NarL/FixJ family response regulator
MARVGRQMHILIADNDPRVRSALRLLLKRKPELMVHASSDLGSLAAQVREFEPDLVLLDWEMPGRPAAALLLAMGALAVKPKVIVLSQRPESEQAALDAGADGFFSKTDPPERLLAALERAIDAENHTDEEVQAAVAD